MEILKATNLSKIYQTGESAVYALNDVTLGIEEGSFVAITGPSGSGNGNEAAVFNTQSHIIQGLNGRFARLIDLTEVGCFQNFHGNYLLMGLS